MSVFCQGQALYFVNVSRDKRCGKQTDASDLEATVSDIREQMLPAKSRKALGSLPSVALSSLRTKARRSKRNIMQEFEVHGALNWMWQLVSVQYFKHINGQIVFGHIFKLTAFKEIAIRIKHDTHDLNLLVQCVSCGVTQKLRFTTELV